MRKIKNVLSNALTPLLIPFSKRFERGRITKLNIMAITKGAKKSFALINPQIVKKIPNSPTTARTKYF